MFSGYACEHSNVMTSWWVLWAMPLSSILYIEAAPWLRVLVVTRSRGGMFHLFLSAFSGVPRTAVCGGKDSVYFLRKGASFSGSLVTIAFFLLVFTLLMVQIFLDLVYFLWKCAFSVSLACCVFSLFPRVSDDSFHFSVRVTLGCDYVLATLWYTRDPCHRLTFVLFLCQFNCAIFCVATVVKWTRRWPVRIPYGNSFQKAYLDEWEQEVHTSDDQCRNVDVNQVWRVDHCDVNYACDT